MTSVYLTALDCEYLSDAILEMIANDLEGIHFRFGDSSEKNPCECIELTPLVKTITVGE